MPIFTLLIGILAGFAAGMVVAAGSWRKALGKLGSYATNVANAEPTRRGAKPLPVETAPPVPYSPS
jgi:hypothetical protein